MPKKTASVGGFLFMVKTDKGFDVTHNSSEPIPTKAVLVRHLDDESSARRFFKNLINRLRSVPKWFIKTDGKFRETDDRWHPAFTARWRVALGRNGISEKFLTEDTWDTKKAAKEAAARLLDDGPGIWTSAVVVKAITEPSAIRVASRYIARNTYDE